MQIFVTFMYKVYVVGQNEIQVKMINLVWLLISQTR